MKHATLLTCLLLLPAAGPVGAAESEAHAIARGGRLYDNWFAEKQVKAPAAANPAYPDAGKFKGDKGTDWRCKECHGWDYRGKAGAYAEGKHYTGIAGITSARGAKVERIVALLGDANHNYGPDLLDDKDRHDLALFVTRGQAEMDRYIDRAAKRANGDEGRGHAYFETVCATCHGLDGKGEDTPPLGQLANENPWEVLHKMVNGQPKWEMPTLQAFDRQVAADILRYIQVALPRE